MNDSPRAESDSGTESVPTCFRHPDREAYVRCNRCERRICPDCMREAPVGFHCVSCVAEGQKSARGARTTFGGKPVRGPYVTWTVLALMAAGFVAQLTSASTPLAAAQSPLVRTLGMWGVGIVGADQWYRLLTAAFLHGSVWHILFNGYATYILGPQLERWLGHGRFACLWLLSALGGSVLSLAVTPAQLSIGASGAVFGLFGALFVLGRRMRVDIRFVLVLLGINLLLTFAVPQISWTGHIGGLVSGLVLGAAYAYLPWSTGRLGEQTARRTRLHAAATAAYAVLLVVVAIASATVVWQI
ncbi:membrane associated rhomboid family serine protease [Haloactinospora alba]|uniref:Membrane associated rhomboid family serine protease n=1 Tax=Haloactinospora alba TaxID=405555 RepID=A0A543N9W5_9ACTN|nr:rhomboid family intramembrane serine protease [Haloactinospora alba]TQN28634.1 membrane associated rhomboid family serine protease [Haloactinospora alba]